MSTFNERENSLGVPVLQNNNQVREAICVMCDEKQSSHFVWSCKSGNTRCPGCFSLQERQMERGFNSANRCQLCTLPILEGCTPVSIHVERLNLKLDIMCKEMEQHQGNGPRRSSRLTHQDSVKIAILDHDLKMARRKLIRMAKDLRKCRRSLKVKRRFIKDVLAGSERYVQQNSTLPPSSDESDNDGWQAEPSGWGSD